MIDWSIIEKKLKGTISDNENRMLEDWIKSDSRHEHFFEKSKHYILDKDDFGWFDKERLQKSWKRYEAQVSLLRRRKRIRIYSSIAAACALIVLSVGVLLWYPSKDVKVAEKKSVISAGTTKAILVLADGSSVDLGRLSKDTLKQGEAVLSTTDNSIAYSKESSIEAPDDKEIFNTIKTPRGGEYVLNLSDGTKVWLNSQSVIKYPVNFKGKYRKVHLEGEAFFKVAKDKSHPFIVKSNSLNVKVLGTSFNVRNYNDEHELHTTLVEGSVEFKTQFGTTILKPGQQAILAKDGMKNVVKEVDAKLYTSWIDGKIVIRNEELESIMNKLSKWYNMEVFYMSEAVRKLMFYAHIDRYDDLNELLSKFEKTGNVRFKVKNNIVYVYEK
jgi:ferric-dicitrate binding protein FerR (iron transport regulator)